MRRLLPLAALVAVLAVPSTAGAAEPVPFGHACTAQNGVRFCPTTAVANNVPSFDGVPLDVDVTLPPSGDGPFPTIVMLHGYGGSKGSFETTTPDPTSPLATLYRYNNTYFAQQGYAVVTYSARGFGHSCGKSDPATGGCAKGWSHLADQRYEIRDTQYLLGLLVDAGIAKADALGVTGISYGGGQSVQLALLRDRVRNLDGSLSPWLTPKGVALSIAAAYPRWPWSDLSRSLQPNGRWLDFAVNAAGAQSRNPIGVQIQSYVNGLYFVRGTTAPPGADPTADLTTWKALADKGEPYGAAAANPLAELSTYHSGVGLLEAAKTGFTAAPLLLQGGWTDELFPAAETLDVYNRLRSLSPTANVALQLGDLGHPRGSNKVAPDQYLNDQAAAFFSAYLKGAGTKLPSGTVTAYTQTCPKKAASKRYTATSWTGIHPGALRFGNGKPQTISSKGGDFRTANDLDPVTHGDACTTFSLKEATNTADYVLEAKRAFTMLGLPTVRASVKTKGRGGQIDARLWDINGTKQTLVTRSVYRLTDNQQGRIVFQLHGNGYRFAKGHLARLELLGRDTPYYRASNTSFSVTVSKLEIELPTREKPSKKTGILKPKLGR